MTRKLILTQDQFDDLWVRADRKSKTVSVDRAALEALLIDHSEVLNLARGLWEGPEPPRRSRVRLES